MREVSIALCDDDRDMLELLAGSIRDGDVLLTTGASVPLSRRRGQEIKQQYLDALHREGTLLL